jgi:hypothetical protein
MYWTQDEATAELAARLEVISLGSPKAGAQLMLPPLFRVRDRAQCRQHPLWQTTPSAN